MSISAHGSVEQVAALLRAGVSKQLEEAISALVKDECNRLIETAVKDVAKAAGKLVGDIHHDPIKNAVIVYLQYNDNPLQEFHPGEWRPVPKK